jgi:CO/xanthine dehydrogenase Mo-binding subunit
VSVVERVTTPTESGRPGTIGTSPTRPDGIAKVQGSFEFSSDLSADGCLWGATLRSPHPHARIVSIDVSAAWKIDGVETVITAADVPGAMAYGLIARDQPVFASEVVRYVGEPIAAVAADHPETCRRALQAIVVHYEVLEPLLDPERAIDGSHPPIHPDGNVIRHQRIVCGDPSATGEIVVEGTYEIGMQDQAFLGLEAALAVPDPGGKGVELHVATQWLHEDRAQIAACLDLPVESVRLVLGGVGGAFGAREDISLQVHTCLLALRLGRPVRIAYSRSESFLGHVHRHPATIWMRHHATTDGEIVKIESRMVFDGGAYASTSSAVLINAVTHTQGPYRCANAVVDGYAVRTNHLPCGAMRGFGVVQACFAHESQMDKLAAACALDPVDIRLRNAMRTGDADHRPAGDERGPGRALHPRHRSSAVAHHSRRRFSDGRRNGRRHETARRCRSHRRSRRRRARDRLGRRHQEPHVLGGLRRLLDGTLPPRRRRRDAQVRDVRGRPGLRHHCAADRAHHSRGRRRPARSHRHSGGLGRLDVGITPDLDEWRCGRRGLSHRA